MKYLKTSLIISALCVFWVGSNTVSAKPPAEDKLDTRLRFAAGIQMPYRIQFESEIMQAQDHRILVSVRLHTADDSMIPQLEAVGLDIVAKYAGLISGYISMDNLLALANLGVVSTVAPVEPPVFFNFEGEHVKSLRADIARKAPLGYDGSGVKVGLLSNSFAFFSQNNPTYINRGTAEEPDYEIVYPPDLDGDGIPDLVGTDSQLSGDLPERIHLIREALPYIINGVDYTLLAYDDEGRALSEVVYDVAPGAEFAYFGASAGNADFANGILELAKAGCKVIVDDYFSAGSPIYQDGEITQAMRHIENEYDVVFISACGNFGSASIEAAFLDSVPDQQDSATAEVPEGNNLHNWNITLSRPFPDPYLDITVPPGARSTIYFYWENPYSGTLGAGATTDYDLYLLSEPEMKEENILTASTNVQGNINSPMGDPFETVSFVNNATDTIQTYYLAVNLKSGPPANFKLIMAGNPRVNVTLQRDVWSIDSYMSLGHPNSPHALSIAAVNFVEHDSGGTALGNPREINTTYYSSRGGVIYQLYSDTGDLLSSPDIRYKPDIAGIDGMNTSFFTGSGGDYGFDDDDMPNFLGTSAAAPSIAGVIVLMRQANPSLSAEQIIKIARSAATDIAEPGFDFNTGFGILYADDAVRAALNPPTNIDEWSFFSPIQ